MKFLRSMLTMAGLMASSAAASQSSAAMKEISYRGGLLRFDLPRDWLEEAEADGSGMYFADGPDRGTLRLNIITAESASELPPDEPLMILKGIRGVDSTKIRKLPNGNLIAEYVHFSVENGTKITLFWWSVTNVVLPRHIRIANFSYTVRSANEGAVDTLADVNMLRNSIESAQFHPEIGETGALH